MQTIRIPSETCSETAVPPMHAFWIRIRQRAQLLRGRGRIVGGSSHSCHWPLAISTVLPEVMTSWGKIIRGELCVGTSWLKRPCRIQRASIPRASRCLMHSPFRLSDSETECPADHRRRATEIVPVRSSGIERGARRGERGSWEKPTPPARAATAAQDPRSAPNLRACGFFFRSKPIVGGILDTGECRYVPRVRVSRVPFFSSSGRRPCCLNRLQ